MSHLGAWSQQSSASKSDVQDSRARELSQWPCLPRRAASPPLPSDRPTSADSSRGRATVRPRARPLPLGSRDKQPTTKWRESAVVTVGLSVAFRGPAPVTNAHARCAARQSETPWATTATLRPEAPLDWAQKTSSRTCSLTTWTLATGTAEAAATPPALAPPARTASSRSVSSSRPSQSREERRLGSRTARRLTCRGQSNQLAVHRRRRRSRRKHRSRHPSRRARTLE